MSYVTTLQQQLERMATALVQALPSLVIALVILLITFVMARFAVKIADRIAGRSHLRADLKQLLDTMVRLMIWVIGSLIALTVAVPSFTPAGAFASLGVGALAIGFAFQDIFENFLAGVLIMLRGKMNIGDMIECQAIQGRVESITLRETHIRQPSNELTIIPNSMLFKNPVKILTDATIRRNEIVVALSYRADLEAAGSIIRKAVEAIDAVDKERPVGVMAQAFGASSIELLVQWWADSSPRDLRITRSEVIKAVKVALDEARIGTPFSSVTDTSPEPVSPAPPPVERSHPKEQRAA